MRLLAVFLLITAALMLWFLFFESIPAQLPATRFQYLNFDADNFFTVWLFVLFATAAAYVASRKSR